MLDEYKTYIINQINKSKIDSEPFYHLFIENIFPTDFYKMLKQKSNYYNQDKYLIARTQDNPTNYINKKFEFNSVKDETIDLFKNIFESQDVKQSILTKFFVNPEKINIQIFKDEIEFVYTSKNKFQNIHTDLPSKFLSLVFYFPDDVNLEEQQQLDNGTILYDKNLNIVKKAKFIPNSVCIFSSHFKSYHGFSTTIERTALVMFYINRDLYDKHQKTNNNDVNIFKNNMLDKLTLYPMLEYVNKNLEKEKETSKINAPFGRVVV